jgi:hypothetical protein
MGADKFGRQKMTPAPVPSKPPPPKAPAAPPLKALPPKGAGGGDDLAAMVASFRRLKKRVIFQTWTLAVLAGLLLLLLPFAKTIDIYYAMTPERTVKLLTGLDMPNMTNRAVLSWATTGITEVMTMGFGDIDIRLPQQKKRFTQKGWDAYMETFDAMKIRESFKQSQLVLTTVPSNTPVVVSQGVNLDNAYQWIIQMPIIMNYATNNNVVRRQRATVTLTIVRVPLGENSFGIAIQNWKMN